jgi:hypothetical protein
LRVSSSGLASWGCGCYCIDNHLERAKIDIPGGDNGREGINWHIPGGSDSPGYRNPGPQEMMIWLTKTVGPGKSKKAMTKKARLKKKEAKSEVGGMPSFRAWSQKN